MAATSGAISARLGRCQAVQSGLTGGVSELPAPQFCQQIADCWYP